MPQGGLCRTAADNLVKAARSRADGRHNIEEFSLDERFRQALRREGCLDGWPCEHPLGMTRKLRHVAWRMRHLPSPANQHKEEQIRGREALAQQPRTVAELVGDHIEHASEALA